MAIQWLWNEKCGEATIKQVIEGEEKYFTFNLYVGNAYLIFLNEWEEDGQEKYSLWSFWADKEHMKRCLGLDKKDKDCYNIYNVGWQTLTKIKLNKKKCRYTKEIVTALVQAFDDIEIELFSETED